MIVVIKNEATEGFDSKYDACKLYGISEAPQLYSMLPDRNLAINVMPDLNGKIIPIGLEVGAAGVYIITPSWNSMSILDNMSVYLEDRKKSLFLKLTPGQEVTIESNPDDKVHRFNLLIKYYNNDVNSLNSDSNSSEELSIYSHDNVIYISSPEKVKSDVFIYNMTGQLVKEQEINGGLHNIRISDCTGYYIVKVISKKKVFTEKVIIVN